MFSPPTGILNGNGNIGDSYIGSYSVIFIGIVLLRVAAKLKTYPYSWLAEGDKIYYRAKKDKLPRVYTILKVEGYFCLAENTYGRQVSLYTERVLALGELY